MIRRLLSWWLWKYGPDVGLLKEAARFGTRPANARAYDYGKAHAAWKKAQRHTGRGTKLPKPLSHTRRAPVIDIRKARQL